MTDLTRLSAADLATKLAAGEVSSVEATQAHLDRIASVDGDVHAFLHVNQGALAAAAEIDRRRASGEVLGELAGVPLAIAAYFWANRLLAVDLPERTAAEIAWFFKAWGFVAVLGLLRPTRGMWLGLLVLDGLAFALIPVLNAFTTDTHLGVTLLNGPWPVAAFDLTVLGLGLLFLFSAWMLHKHKPKAKTAKVAKAVKPAAPKVDKATVAPQPAAATATLADKPAPSRGQPFLDGDGLPEVQGS